jgi:hypothetical protein
MQIDNIVYFIGLSERVRSRIEDAGRVRLTDAEVVALVRMKVVHVGFFVLTILGSVWAVRAFGKIGWQFLPIAGPALGGLAEAFVVPGATAGVIAKRVATHAAKWFGGMLFMMAVMGVSMAL